MSALGWYGKRFDSPDAVHPLVFEDRRGLFCVNPAGLSLRTGLRLGRLLNTPTAVTAIRNTLRIRRRQEAVGAAANGGVSGRLERNDDL
ncbi:GXWXG domain-containing protein [[Mycobacterium] wendilense]|uniref:GXWXG domain-containing protein n=1 Tax=[Mycobacterium] wendilense TaxID=3064284 RepID=A0ABM9MJN2_9MYCO|nr:GXWXG domain-containing protein [Mycolicibacterium sp. MU0050]CAJ1586866.1 GXWXG domain-containing protein [Mycolicibacterium sp. MU0050]